MRRCRAPWQRPGLSPRLGFCGGSQGGFRREHTLWRCTSILGGRRRLSLWGSPQQRGIHSWAEAVGLGRGERGTALTLVLTGTQQVDDVGVMAQFAQHLQLPSKVPMIILRSKLWKKRRDGYLSPTTRTLLCSSANGSCPSSALTMAQAAAASPQPSSHTHLSAS